MTEAFVILFESDGKPYFPKGVYFLEAVIHDETRWTNQLADALTFKSNSDARKFIDKNGINVTKMSIAKMEIH